MIVCIGRFPDPMQLGESGSSLKAAPRFGAKLRTLSKEHDPAMIERVDKAYHVHITINDTQIYGVRPIALTFFA